MLLFFSPAALALRDSMSFLTLPRSSARPISCASSMSARTAASRSLSQFKLRPRAFGYDPVVRRVERWFEIVFGCDTEKPSSLKSASQRSRNVEILVDPAGSFTSSSSIALWNSGGVGLSLCCAFSCSCDRCRSNACLEVWHRKS